MSAYLDWLLAACRFWLTAEPEDAPRKDPPDWGELAGLAYFNDLDPLLHRLASAAFLDLDARLPARVRRQWQGAYYRNFVFNTELLDLVAGFLDGCAERSLEARVFKGPVTAARGWVDPTTRIMADVDLYCRRSELPQLAELARGLGFETGAQTATHHLALRHESLPGSLELHFELYQVAAGGRALEHELWSQAHYVEIDERRLPALDPELAAVFDLAHLVQHDLQVNLRQLLDLAATLWRQRRLLDRARLSGLLGEADLEPEFQQVLDLLDELGLPVDESLRSAPGRTGAAGLRQATVERLLSPQELDRGGAFAGPHRRDGLLATAGYVTRRLLPPLEQIQAMTGAASRSRALLGYPAHVVATLRRGARRWRKGGSGRRPAGSASIKRQLFERRGRY